MLLDIVEVDDALRLLDRVADGVFVRERERERVRLTVGVRDSVPASARLRGTVSRVAIAPTSMYSSISADTHSSADDRDGRAE